jgi:hypothetical protein
LAPPLQTAAKFRAGVTEGKENSWNDRASWLENFEQVMRGSEEEQGKRFEKHRTAARDVIYI